MRSLTRVLSGPNHDLCMRGSQLTAPMPTVLSIMACIRNWLLGCGYGWKSLLGHPKLCVYAIERLSCASLIGVLPGSKYSLVMSGCQLTARVGERGGACTCLCPHYTELLINFPQGRSFFAYPCSMSSSTKTEILCVCVELLITKTILFFKPFPLGISYNQKPQVLLYKLPHIKVTYVCTSVLGV